jgi:hypothetical protein
MAYVPRFQYDVFISYAVVDNNRPVKEKPGWVDVFEEQLTSELERLVNQKRPVKVWRDTKRLSCGDKFTDEIGQAVSNAAVMVVLLSKQYLASEWCKKERATFLAAMAAQQNVEKRLFVVQLTDPRLFDRLPDGLAEIHHAQLWRQDGGIPKPLGHPVPDHQKSEHQGFFDGVYAIAYAIAGRLDEFPAVGETAPTNRMESAEISRSEQAGAAAVYLAVAPKESREEGFTSELKAALENAIPAVHVVQPQELPAAGGDARALVADLQRVRLYDAKFVFLAPNGLSGDLRKESHFMVL